MCTVTAERVPVPALNGCDGQPYKTDEEGRCTIPFLARGFSLRSSKKDSSPSPHL